MIAATATASLNLLRLMSEATRWRWGDQYLTKAFLSEVCVIRNSERLQSKIKILFNQSHTQDVLFYYKQHTCRISEQRPHAIVKGEVLVSCPPQRCSELLGVQYLAQGPLGSSLKCQMSCLCLMTITFSGSGKSHGSFEHENSTKVKAFSSQKSCFFFTSSRAAIKKKRTKSW